MQKKPCFNNKRLTDKASSSESSLAANDIKMQLRAEKLDVSKNKVKTGEVSVHKEIIKKCKTIRVPVTKEELVIERKVFDGTPQGKISVIRIPILEESVEIIKHPVVLENVKVYNRQFREIKHISKVLKKEQLHIQTTGSARVIEGQTESMHQ